ncbi:ParM/StbA family protein [Peribacillus frigoritolerans]|uniref:Actin-like protein N-terminal domain-containing protein n=1 Tax=Peribacillus castrilensis TaxID=2897690 RepID=A0AAW9NHP7_9BACI|nr:hypothetical protein [Peribacillus castrilensis]
MVANKRKKFDRVLGIDLGNGLIKIRSVKPNGKDYSVILPSSFAYLKDVGDSVNNTSLQLDVFTIDDVDYVWGEDINQVGEVKSTYGHENRYKTEAYKLMAKMVLARAVRDLDIKPNENILLVTGVPSAETGTEREEEIVAAFIGEGKQKGLLLVGVNGVEHIFKVVHVEVQAQALATVIGRYLATDGTVENENYEHWKVAVIDIGAGTIDLDIVHSLRRQKGYHSVPKGFRDVYETIRTGIAKIYPSHTVNDYELLGILEETQKKNALTGKNEVIYEYKPSHLRKSVDFTKDLHDGVKEVVVDVQQAIMSKWKNQTDLDEILLVGGSAELFKDHLNDIVYGITIPRNNGDSNVEGYFRFGMYLMESEDE